MERTDRRRCNGMPFEMSDLEPFLGVPGFGDAGSASVVLPEAKLLPAST